MRWTIYTMLTNAGNDLTKIAGLNPDLSFRKVTLQRLDYYRSTKHLMVYSTCASTYSATACVNIVFCEVPNGAHGEASQPESPRETPHEHHKILHCEEHIKHVRILHSTIRRGVRCTITCLKYSPLLYWWTCGETLRLLEATLVPPKIHQYII